MKQEIENKSMPGGWHKSTSFRESYKHAWNGIKLSYKTEMNLRIQIGFYVLALAGALLLQLSFAEISILILIATMIVTLEMVNTAVEYFSNIIEPKYNDAVRLIKDISAGAVLFASGAAIVIGVLLFLPRIILLLLG